MIVMLQAALAAIGAWVYSEGSPEWRWALFAVLGLPIAYFFLIWSSSSFVRPATARVSPHEAGPLPRVLFSARPSFVEGMARMMDFGGALGNPPPPFSPAEQDRLAFALDWMELGVDLAHGAALTRRDLEARRLYGTWLAPLARDVSATSGPASPP